MAGAPRLRRSRCLRPGSFAPGLAKELRACRPIRGRTGVLLSRHARKRSKVVFEITASGGGEKLRAKRMKGFSG